tara:strand:+ start:9688 stop:10125 length:438 start_codon:yes stop_codon:yes gene_type:complete
MSKNKFNRRGKSSLQRQLKDLPAQNDQEQRKIVFSFRDFDRNQGQPFTDWEEDKLLALSLDKLSQLSQLTMAQAQQQQLLKIYTKVDFPPKSEFKYPQHIKDGVTWASFHVKGKECIIGHVEDEIFHIVFLDKNHEFWISEKKNT